MTDDIKLPPLPEWMCDFQIPADDQDDSDFNWLDWRMKEYARAAVLADRANLAPLQAENERLRAEVERLREKPTNGSKITCNAPAGSV